ALPARGDVRLGRSLGRGPQRRPRRRAPPLYLVALLVERRRVAPLVLMSGAARAVGLEPVARPGRPPTAGPAGPARIVGVDHVERGAGDSGALAVSVVGDHRRGVLPGERVRGLRAARDED